MGAAPKGTFGVKNFRKTFEFGLRYCAGTLNSYTQMFFWQFFHFWPPVRRKKVFTKTFSFKNF